jgi:hypothetical protein
VPANAKYAQCQHTQSGIQMWLFQAMGALPAAMTRLFEHQKRQPWP